MTNKLTTCLHSAYVQSALIPYDGELSSLTQRHLFFQYGWPSIPHGYSQHFPRDYEIDSKKTVQGIFACVYKNQFKLDLPYLQHNSIFYFNGIFHSISHISFTFCATVNIIVHIIKKTTKTEQQQAQYTFVQAVGKMKVFGIEAVYRRLGELRQSYFKLIKRLYT